MSEWDPGVQGKTVVVTGTASGIGAAVAETLVTAGAEVIGLDLGPSPAATKSIVCDLSEPAAIDAVVADLPDTLYGLVNVAGVPGTRPAELVWKVNFLGLRHLTEAVLDRVVAGGSIVHVASTAGFGWPGRVSLLAGLMEAESFDDGLAWFRANAPADLASYDFTKEAVTVYAMRSGLRGAARGVRVNSVSPGPVETPILADFEATMGKELLDGVRTMTGRHGTPQDIAPVVAFLLSPASTWIRGSNLVADGGAIGAVASGAVAIP
jgi:NAD(P)-dependent dehydrogenase (short-subunit alcohol dehydrogenase family)